MRLREEVSQPGLVIDLMTAAAIIAVPILLVIVCIEVPPHILYHRGPNWHYLGKRLLGYAVAYSLLFGATRLWQRRRLRRLTQSDDPS
jgi:hypothetical protein